MRAVKPEEFRMLQGATDEGAQPNGIWGHLGDPAAAVGHLEVEGDEVESVVVFPLVEAGVDFAGVLIEQFGLEPLLLGRAHCVLLEVVVLFHDTDFF